MLNRLFRFAGGLLLGLLALAFSYFTYLLISDAVIPLLRQSGSPPETYQVLNIYWRGSAILIPTGAYLLIAAACACGSWRLMRHKKQSLS